jgi:hypothetical protein
MKRIIAIMMVMVLVVGTSMAMAAETEDPVTGAVKTVGKAAKGTVDTAVSPFKAMGDENPSEVIVAPVKTGAKTVGEAAVDTGKTATMQKVDMEE